MFYEIELHDKSSYIIDLVLSAEGRPFHPSVLSSFVIRPIIRPVIRPSKFLIPEEEDDGTGGGRRLMAVAAVYRHIHVILLAQFVLALQNCFCCVCMNLAKRAMEGQRWRYEIVQTLIVAIEPDKTVKRAMNEINAGEQTPVSLLCPFVPCSSSMLNWLLFKI